MRTRKLGNTDLQLTTIGFGAWAIGGAGWKFSWGKQDDQDSIDAIQRSVDLGINWIDTAAIYGLGHSEEVVGKAIKGRRDDLIIATKCSMVWDENKKISFSLDPQSIRRECEASLKRLDIDVIDLYQIHWPNDEENIEAGWSEMTKLIEEGKIRYAGLSNFNEEQMERCRKIHPIASLQPPYNMVNRDVEKGILPYCAEHNIGVVAYSPMLSGLLTGKWTRERTEQLDPEDWRRESKNFNEPRLSQILALVDKLRQIADKHNITVAQLSLAWVLRRPEVTSAIAGARSPRQIEETAEAGNIDLPEQDIQQIEEWLNQLPD